ncbi:E3 SUMO-protein ligase MMS21 [Macadamia integrifolia]|uniref:E3 SUMO-protein ligase MMS21 n=1 Tax=Macadamia integrifolia TaxID=60698 RepID=UPI001C52B498|nr:E3 SUMO-protein ligase MMS21 [Macadamia integrifolia]
MASASASRSDGGVGRMRNAALIMYEENQSLIADIRKALAVIKGIAVDLERDNQYEKVGELEGVVLELLVKSEECAHFSSAIQSVANNYQGCPPGDELTDFKKLLDDEVKKIKATSSSLPQKHILYRQFKEAVWNVHHAGQSMPGEEEEDIVMTSTESNILNVTCPLSGKPVTELAEPVRSMDCKHIYEKNAVPHYMKSKGAHPQCPVAGCPKILQAGRILCDPLLRVEIEELRLMSKQNACPAMVEDFTEL